MTQGMILKMCKTYFEVHGFNATCVKSHNHNVHQLYGEELDEVNVREFVELYVPLFANGFSHVIFVLVQV